MPSSDGVPVDVVGRPSIGEGRTPGGVGAGGAMEGTFALSVVGVPDKALDSAMLRLRKAMNASDVQFARRASKLWQGIVNLIDNSPPNRRHGMDQSLSRV